MPVRFHLPVLFLLALPGLASSQTTPQKISNGAQSTVPRLTAALQGVNAGVTLSSLHDSITGWATLATPAIGYKFNDHLNVDATIPIYFYRLAESRSPRPRPDAELVARRAELGDLVLGLHSTFFPKLAEYQLTGLIAVPTGDELYGLTSGRVTFDANNHFERTFRRVTPDLEFGIGDSSTLTNRIVTKDYTSLGPLAHFQAGFSLDLPRDLSFETDAYEQLPIGNQKIYGPSRHGNGTVVIGHNITEDNGFTSSLDIPLNRHATFSAYYNRSLRIHTDTVAIGITYVLRPAPPPELPNPDPDLDLDDLFR